MEASAQTFLQISQQEKGTGGFIRCTAKVHGTQSSVGTVFENKYVASYSSVQRCTPTHRVMLRTDV